jgi:hypothetical protein
MSPSGTGPKGYEAGRRVPGTRGNHRIILCCLVQNTDLVISRDDLVFERAGKFGKSMAQEELRKVPSGTYLQKKFQSNFKKLGFSI